MRTKNQRKGLAQSQNILRRLNTTTAVDFFLTPYSG